MYDLTYDLLTLCRRHKEGGFETQRKRYDVLRLVGDELRGELKFRHLTTLNVKPKHIEAVVSHWKQKDLANSTIVGRMTHIRWWLSKVGKADMIPKNNRDFGIGTRTAVSPVSKAVDISKEQLNQIRDDYVRTSVELAKAFGLRKKEALMIRPSLADKGDHLVLKASWCKGRRTRTVPIRTQEQRDVLDRAKALVNNGSLIRPDNNFYEQRKAYENITSAVGLKSLHGVRHRYAQTRYKELTGWESPHNDGPTRRELSSKEKEVDLSARKIITEELGHSRLDVLPRYLGR